MAFFTDDIKIKLSEDKKSVIISIKENENKVSVFIINRSSFEKIVNEYKTLN